MKLNSTLGQLRALAILEGISYLLFGLTMPLKYVYEINMPNRIVGMIHGILFIAYIVWVLLAAREKKWGYQLTAICLVASLLPFATFWVDAKLLKSLHDSEK